jgi:hypothetical protein
MINPSQEASQWCNIWNLEKKLTRFNHKSITIYNLYKWKLNHGQTIWYEEWDVIGNVLMNTLGTEKEKEKTKPPNLPIGYFQKGLSPFRTWSNTPIIKGGHV